MKKIMRPLTLGGLLAAAPPTLVLGQSAVTAGVRRHAEHSVFTDLPYGNGDLSYALGYELHEQNALWQLAADYAPDITGTNNVHAVFTPQLNLLFKDKIWRAGVGLLDSYIERKGDEQNGWTSPYWQFILGVNIPINKFSLGAAAYYPFAHWSELSQFDVRDLDYGVSLSYTF